MKKTNQPYFIVVFENGNEPFYLADWEGDPGRTLLKGNAKRFPTKIKAEKAKNKAIKDYPLRQLSGEVILIPNRYSSKQKQ